METRTALLNSAELAARKRGYDGFSYADLAQAVGIRKASIHHHFPKKADLALALIERYAVEFSAALLDIDALGETAADKLRAYQALYRDALADGTQLCLCVSFSAGRDSLTDPVLDRLNQFHQDSLAWLERVFEAAEQDGSVAYLTDPKAEASATLALMEGAQLAARAAKDMGYFDRALASFTARLALPQTE